MRVRVDEAGENGIGGEIGDRDAGGRGVSDGLDAVAGDEDVGVRANGAGADIDEFAGKHGLRHRRLVRYAGLQAWKRQGKGRQGDEQRDAVHLAIEGNIRAGKGQKENCCDGCSSGLHKSVLARHNRV